MEGTGKTSLLAFYHPSSYKIPFNIIVPSAHAFWKRFFSYKFSHLYILSKHSFSPPYLPHAQWNHRLWCSHPNDTVTKSPVQTKRKCYTIEGCGMVSLTATEIRWSRLDSVQWPTEKESLKTLVALWNFFTSQQDVRPDSEAEKKAVVMSDFVILCCVSVLSNKWNVRNFNKTISTVFRVGTRRTWEWGPCFFCQCFQLPGCECWNWMTHVTRYVNVTSVFWLKVTFLDENTVKTGFTLGIFLFYYSVAEFGVLHSCSDQAAVWTTKESLDFLQRARYFSLRHNVRRGSGTS
jgi:hypothetical protein